MAGVRISEILEYAYLLFSPSDRDTMWSINLPITERQTNVALAFILPPKCECVNHKLSQSSAHFYSIADDLVSDFLFSCLLLGGIRWKT